MALETQLDIKTLNFQGQRTFLRLDLNVPNQNGKILDSSRIQATLPTLEFLIARGAKIVVASHLGRPKNHPKDQKNFSMKPVANALNKEGFEVLFMETPDSEAPRELLKGLTGKQIIMLENLRFHEGEMKNSNELAAKWLRYTDIYVNDAFGASHRAHASLEALPKQIPKRCYGLLIARELECLKKIKDNPPAPFVLVTGGSKVFDKIPLLKNLSGKIHSFIIGGAMAYTFLKARGYDPGNSKVEEKSLLIAKNFLKQMETKGKKVYLPLDHIIIEKKKSHEFRISKGPGLSGQETAMDIGPETCSHFTEVLEKAACIFWNGPMGVYERKPFDKGSIAVAKAIGRSKAFTVIGGGDSAAVAKIAGLSCKTNSFSKEEKNNVIKNKLSVDHISTGGGASLEFIQGHKLPGLEVLKIRGA